VAFTDAQLTALDAAIAKGELIVEFADRKVQYRSIEELLQARAVIAASLGQGSPRQYIGVSSKGL
jgi:hypothetical protein